MKKEVKGNHAYIVFQTGLDEKYHRNGLCLKIFKAPIAPYTKIEEATWSNENNGFRENLMECTKIQNLLAFQGLAPRVYDLIFMVINDQKHAVQVTDYIPEGIGEDITQKVIDYCNKVGIKAHDIGGGANIRNGLFTDFQEFEFMDYEKGLVKRLSTGLAYAGTKDQSYQSVEELGIIGERVNSEREKLIQIPDGLPEGFTVMDFGCNGAYFLRRAFDKGASYGVGIDVPRVNEAARELNNYLGYFNMDFMDYVPDMEFDLVLILSAFGYARVEQIFPKAKVALIEGHCLNGQHTEKYYYERLKPYYSKIKTLGWVKDDPDLPPRVVMKGER
jgi:hypothetical protein